MWGRLIFMGIGFGLAHVVKTPQFKNLVEVLKQGTRESKTEKEKDCSSCNNCDFKFADNEDIQSEKGDENK